MFVSDISFNWKRERDERKYFMQKMCTRMEKWACMSVSLYLNNPYQDILEIFCMPGLVIASLWFVTGKDLHKSHLEFRKPYFWKILDLRRPICQSICFQRIYIFLVWALEVPQGVISLQVRCLETFSESYSVYILVSSVSRRFPLAQKVLELH